MDNYYILIGGFTPLVKEFNKNNIPLINIKKSKKPNRKYISDSGNITFEIKDLSNYEELSNIIKELKNDYNIEKIIVFNEKYFENILKICEEFSLVSNINFNAINIIDKYKLRETLKFLFKNFNYGLLNNRIKISDFPVVVKPRKGSGSESVKIIKSNQEISSLSKNNTLLYEKFIEGEEYSVEAFHYNNKHYIIGITKKLKYKNTVVEKGHIANYIKLSDEQKEKLFDIYTILNINNNTSHTEIIIDKENKINIVETHLRFGGDFIPDLYNDIYNLNLFEILFSILTNRENTENLLKSLKVKLNQYSWSLFPYPSNNINKYNGINLSKDIEKKYNIKRKIEHLQKGDKLKNTPESSFDRPLLLTGILEGDIDSKLLQLEKEIKFD